MSDEKELITVFGEDYITHGERAKRAFNDLIWAEEDDRKTYPRARFVSNSRLLTSVLNIELEAMVRTNPNTTPEEKDRKLAILERIKFIEEQNLMKRKKRETKRIKTFYKSLKTR